MRMYFSYQNCRKCKADCAEKWIQKPPHDVRVTQASLLRKNANFISAVTAIFCEIYTILPMAKFLFNGEKQINWFTYDITDVKWNRSFSWKHRYNLSARKSKEKPLYNCQFMTNFAIFRSENCRKWVLANRHSRNWELYSSRLHTESYNTPHWSDRHTGFPRILWYVLEERSQIDEREYMVTKEGLLIGPQGAPEGQSAVPP